MKFHGIGVKVVDLSRNRVAVQPVDVVLIDRCPILSGIFATFRRLLPIFSRILAAHLLAIDILCLKVI